MIYQINQVSNRDVQLLHFYRILRHASTELSALYRYSEPDAFRLPEAKAVVVDNNEFFEYQIQLPTKDNRIPYLEFSSSQGDDIIGIELLTEVEIKDQMLIIRSRGPIQTDDVLVSLYWVPSLAFIDSMMLRIEEQIKELQERAAHDLELIQKLILHDTYALSVDGLPPNLVSIGNDSTGLIYDDSHYKLSGSLAPQLLVNPTQELISSLLKSQMDTLEIHDTTNSDIVYQGFYGGCIKISGVFKTLVLKDITSILYLDAITATHIVIENCPSVIFRHSLEQEGASGTVERLDLRNSYLTTYQAITIESAGCYRKSTWVHKKGRIKQLAFVEAGSAFIFDKPSSSNRVDNPMITAFQGLFYAKSPMTTQPYLDDIFINHQAVAFQRGSIDDPMPISSAEVQITLKKTTPTPTPTPTPGGKIYSPFTDWYWSGDSRVVQLIAQTHTDGAGYGSAALPKLIEVKTDIETQGTNHNIILWWGVNGLSYGAQAYVEVYQSIADTVGNNAKVFIATVGHCPDGTGSGKVDGGAGQDLVSFNQSIQAFNDALIQDVSSIANLTLIDVDRYIQELEDTKGAAWLTNDNLHYKPEASQAIYDWVCDQITNVEPGDIPDAPTDTNAGIIWNWFKYAGIPNVSNRPELIAGIIGNCQTESYPAIDVLGYHGEFYGPWCESNVGFRSYMVGLGYTFHDYTRHPGDDSAAIPDIFTWLTQQSSSWDWLYDSIDSVTSQTGEAGARAYAELFAVCVERCVYGSFSIQDPGVYQVMVDFYGNIYQYQDLDVRRDYAADIYNRFMNV